MTERDPRIDRTLPPADSNFAKTVFMFDIADFWLSTPSAHISCIDIEAQNLTGGFDVIMRCEVDKFLTQGRPEKTAHGLVFKVSIRGHLDQSLEKP